MDGYWWVALLQVAAPIGWLPQVTAAKEEDGSAAEEPVQQAADEEAGEAEEDEVCPWVPFVDACGQLGLEAAPSPWLSPVLQLSLANAASGISIFASPG